MTDNMLETGCGRTLEELNDYLHGGHFTDAEHIAACPQCQAAIPALRRLDALTSELVADDVRQAGTTDEPWFRSIMANVRLETKAGRSIPLETAVPADDLSETEGAVVALLRRAGDAVEGAMIGKCRLHGDLQTPGAPIAVQVNVTAFWGQPIPTLAANLRGSLLKALATHTQLNVDTVDITITDIHAEVDL